MSIISCPECGKEISDTAKKCIGCGYKQKKGRRKRQGNLKKKIIIISSIVIGVIIMLSIVLFVGNSVDWSSDTLSKIIKTGSYQCLIEHSWENATCGTSKCCKNCGLTDGDALGHDWTDATCETPKTCKKCNKTQGDAKGHSWAEANCTSSKKCKKCKKKEGLPLSHNFVDYKCTRCQATNVTASDVPNILDITSCNYEINSVGGIDTYFTFVNRYSKTIAYISLELQFYNAVGDVIQNEIGGGTSSTIKYTGPLESGKTSERTYWRACFYNGTFSGTMGIKKNRY